MFDPDCFAKSGKWAPEDTRKWQDAVLSQPADSRRDYEANVVSRLQKLDSNHISLTTYRTSQSGDEKFDHLFVTIGDLGNGNPNILLIGGVHGNEPSGVEACVRIAEQFNESADPPDINIVIFPCLFPWSYVHNQRWVYEDALDPNRHMIVGGSDFGRVSTAESFMFEIADMPPFAIALDFHETNDSDIKLWRKMRTKRYGGKSNGDGNRNPNGFHLMASECPDTLKEERKKIAQKILSNVAQHSRITTCASVTGYPCKVGTVWASGDKRGFTRTFLNSYANHVFVTEVVPELLAANEEEMFEKAVQCQLAAFEAALDHLRPAV